MITPTVGRVVLFNPSGPLGEGEQPFAALVTYVHNERLINVAYFDANGNPGAFTSVKLLQDDDPAPDMPYCEWMPYQKGQAAKTEALEAKLAPPVLSSRGPGGLNPTPRCEPVTDLPTGPQLTEGTPLHGRVLDTFGKPMVGLQIGCANAEGCSVCETDRQGHYKLLFKGDGPLDVCIQNGELLYGYKLALSGDEPPIATKLGKHGYRQEFIV